MASKSLGTLTIDLVAKTAGFVQGMTKAERESAKFRKSIEKDMKKVGGFMAKSFAAASTAVVAGTVAIVKKQMELIDQTSKMAKALNTSYQSMENIKRAAELSGVGVEQLDNAMKKLADNIGEAVSGSKSQVETFNRLGLSAKEIAAIPVDERVKKINAALKENVTAAERAAVAADLYGAKNALFMSQIDEGTIEEAARQVRIFGLAISNLDAEKIEMAGDSMSVFGTALDGFEKQLTIALAPALYAVSDAFLDVSEDAGGFGVQGQKAAAAIVESFGAIGDVTGALRRSFQLLGSGLANVYLRAERFDKQIDLFFVKLKGGSTRLSVKGLQSEIENLDRAIQEANAAPNDILMGTVFSERIKALIKAAQADLDKLAKENAEKRKREIATGSGVAVDSNPDPFGMLNKNSALDDIGSTGVEGNADLLMYGMPKEQFFEALREDSKSITRIRMEEEEKLTALLAEESRKRREEQMAANMTTLDNYENLFASLHGLSEAFGKENSKTARAMFALSKAAAVAKAMLAISASAQAMGDAAVKTEQRIAHAATIASAVAGIVASVKSVKMQGMAHDGIDSVPKTGTWLLEKGERVMTSETSAKLDKKLDTMGGRYKIVNVIDPRMVADYLSTDSGEELVMNIIGRNQSAIAAYARG